MRTIIRNGWIVEGSVRKADLLIEDGKVVEIGEHLEGNDAQVIEAEGRYVLPGAVDVHTHFDLQAGIHRAADDFYQGTVAAAFGGTTAIVDHMAFGPAGCTLQQRVDEYHGLADGKAVVDYGFHGVLQRVTADILEEMEHLMEEGIPSFKAYMTYDFRLTDEELLRVMASVKKAGGVLTVHAEDHETIETLKKEHVAQGKCEPIYHAKSRPNLTEAQAVARLLALSAKAGYPNLYLVHISAKESLDEIRKAKESGAENVFVETCIQYLYLTEDRYLLPDGEGLKYVMSPPLRKKADVEALWEGIRDGLVQVVGTDHCPFRFETKLEYGGHDFTRCPNGGPGVEERVRVLFTEGVMKDRISLQRFVEVSSLNPSKIMGMYPEKGNLMPGADADIILIDPGKSGTIKAEDLQGNAGYSLYEGYGYQGEIELVMQRGNILVSDGHFLGKEGDGEFLVRRIPTLPSWPVG